jgi:hypothetical protein
MSGRTASHELWRGRVGGRLGWPVRPRWPRHAKGLPRGRRSGSALKEYGDLLSESPDLAERAKAFSAKVRDITELPAGPRARRSTSGSPVTAEELGRRKAANLQAVEPDVVATVQLLDASITAADVTPATRLPSPG